MKKLVLVLVFALFSITAINAEETNPKQASHHQPQCVIVENVSFSLDSRYTNNGKCSVTACNHNNFRVNVYYTVKAYDSNGNERTVYSGSMVVNNPSNNDSGCETDHFSVDSNLTSFHLVDIRATKCNY